MDERRQGIFKSRREVSGPYYFYFLSSLNRLIFCVKSLILLSDSYLAEDLGSQGKEKASQEEINRATWYLKHY